MDGAAVVVDFDVVVIGNTVVVVVIAGVWVVGDGVGVDAVVVVLCP